MKKMDEILKRDDYVRLTPSLKAAAKDVARRIREKIADLDLANDADFYHGEIGTNGVAVRIESVKSHHGEYEFLAIKRTGECYGDASWFSLEDIGEKYYFKGDYSAEVCGASNKEAIAFLNVAKRLIKGLGEVEQKRKDSAQQALGER